MSASRRLVIVTVIGVAVAACGGSDEPADTTSPQTSVATTAGAAETTTTIDAGATTTATPATVVSGSTSLRDLRADLGIGSMELRQAEEGGLHPTLEWDQVDDATSYWLVVRDSTGLVFWAWTGADTSVRIGGGDRAELNQTAALHEPMTWSVTAIDGSGNVIAFSDVATVAP